MTLSAPTSGVSGTSPIFSIPELLEKIISELPPLDIIRCQQINRTWSTIIANSPLLQYKAWLRNDYAGHIPVLAPEDLMEAPVGHESKSDDEGEEYDRESNEEEPLELSIEEESRESSEEEEHNEISEEEEDDDIYEEENSKMPEEEQAIESDDDDEWAEVSDDEESMISDPSNSLPKRDEMFYTKISKRLNPIIVACIRNLPTNISCLVYEGHIDLPPILLRNLIKWYEVHKDSEETWGKLSLCRPDVGSIKGETGLSTGSATVEFGLTAKLATKSEDVGKVTWGVTHKAPNEPLELTLRDFMREVKSQWEDWLHAEREEHFFTHDHGTCNMSYGLPEECLRSAEKAEQGKDHGRDDEASRRKSKKSLEDYIDSLVRRASRDQ